MTGLPTIHGERVTLRPPVASDAEARAAAGRDPEIARCYGIRRERQDRLSPEEATAWFERITAQPCEWVIEHDGRAIGTVRLTVSEQDPRLATMAMGLFSVALFNRGLGTEALGLAMAAAADEPMRLTRLRLRVAEYNHRAIACYRKCGFVFDGIEPRAFEMDGTWYDDHLMTAQLSPGSP